MPLVSQPIHSSSRNTLNAAAPSWDPFGFRPAPSQERPIEGSAAIGASLSPTSTSAGVPLLGPRRDTMPHLTLTAQPPTNYHYEDSDPLRSPPGVAASSRTSSGGNQSQRPPVGLVAYNLPGDLTPREAHLIFAFAPEFISCEVARPTAEEMSFCAPDSTVVFARFHSIQAATTAQMMLDNRADLFADYPTAMSTARGSQDSTSPPPVYPIRCEVRGPGSQNSSAAGKSRFMFGEDETCSISASRPGSVTSIMPQFGPAMPPQSKAAYGSLSVADRIFSPANPRPIAQGRTLFGDHLNNSISGLHISGMGSVSAPGTGESHVMSRRPSAPALGAPAPGTAGPSVCGVPQRAPTAVRQYSQSSIPTEDPSKVVIPYNPQTQAKAAAVLQNGGRVMPPANPADQNPPCNTLYVGNLPPDTQESELKDLFSRRAGYRRLCFRAKSNGPMCFVEFEDEHYAGRALEELYGFGLSNSIKGGIRLSYSKNPLGVRSNRPRNPTTNGLVNGSSHSSGQVTH